jgi:predicted  nucleic acid-binding Zn-ribbon protein
MLTEREGAPEQMIMMNLDGHADTQDVETLSEQLLSQQPQSEPLLKRLLARSGRPFAPVRDGRCSACNVTIATAREQAAKAGGFINCANCSRFLYCQLSVSGPGRPRSAHPTPF